MSMSQEEIESLMNGLDLGENESSQEEEAAQAAPVEEAVAQPEETTVNETVSNDDIDALMNGIAEPTEVETNDELQVDDILSQIEEKPASNDDLDDLLANIDDVDSSSNATVSNDDIDALLNGMEEPTPAPAVEEESIDDVLSSIDEQEVSQVTQEEPATDDFDDILAGIEGMSEEPKVESAPLTDSTVTSEDEIGEKIKEGVFPLPAEKDTKVVNQLSQVANDSEEKASKIFDVLSFVLDDNNDVQKSVKNLEDFIEKQTALLESLNAKFPNIAIFNEHLEAAKNTKAEVSKINAKIDAENMQIFEAMELMQFHDINRQKIERVMAVIRKLSIYLNNLFEDEGTHKEVAVAKHIHGDNTADLAGDDLEALIAEFGN